MTCSLIFKRCYRNTFTYSVFGCVCFVVLSLYPSLSFVTCQQAQGAIHETRSLRSKVHLAEQAQRAARNMEQDYEEVVKLLEKEIAEMKEELDKRKVFSHFRSEFFSFHELNLPFW